MKSSIKYLFMDPLFRVYEFVAARTERMKAARMWHDGVRQCERMYAELGGPRVYLFFDSNHLVWSPMTYEPNRQFKPSLRQLRWMGKMHGAAKVRNVEDMKRLSYYYTPSRHGAPGCVEDNRVRASKLRLWTAYYMTSLSEPMRKCREYRRGLAERHPARG